MFPGFNPSESQMKKLAQQVDLSNEDVQEALLSIGEDRIRPQLDDIKTRAESASSPEQIREQLADMPNERKNEVFHETWAEFITACVELRVKPLEGMRNLKTMIRDPWTVEIMLLLMEDEEIPDGITEANKDMISQYVSWIGRALAPEMYEREDVAEMVDQFGADPELLDKWDESNIPEDI